MVAYRPLATKLYSQHKVRTSLHDRTLESMIPVLNPSRSDGDDVSKKTVGLREIPESNCDLTSILELRKSVQKSVHHGLSHRQFEWDDGRLVYSTDLTEIIKKHTFVRIVDGYRCLSLIQNTTKPYLLNHAALMYVLLSTIQSPKPRRCVQRGNLHGGVLCLSLLEGSDKCASGRRHSNKCASVCRSAR